MTTSAVTSNAPASAAPASSASSTGTGSSERAAAPGTATAQTAPEQAPAPPPVPVLAPYLGLVAAVLCTLGGGWLLLAPYALDLRHGAKHLPRAATVDLETGAAIIAVGVIAAVLFAANLVQRLRGDGPGAAPAAEPANRRPEEPPEATPAPERSEPVQRPEPAQPKEADPGNALRDLLTPLVAALAADLRSHDQERTERKGP